MTAPVEAMVAAPANEAVSAAPESNESANEKTRERRRSPRHLRSANNARRRRSERSPMPLTAAVASPELASGKVWIDYSQTNAAKENSFLSVDELLEQEKTKKGLNTPATGIVVEEKVAEAQPALNFITQPANESVQKKVQASLERLSTEAAPAQAPETSPAAAPVATQAAPVEEFVRSYHFTGRCGTFSAVSHTRVEMTQAKADETPSEPFAIEQWTQSRYYFHGKGSAGHHSAISHVYAEPTQAQ